MFFKFTLFVNKKKKDQIERYIFWYFRIFYIKQNARDLHRCTFVIIQSYYWRRGDRDLLLLLASKRDCICNTLFSCTVQYFFIFIIYFFFQQKFQVQWHYWCLCCVTLYSFVLLCCVWVVCCCCIFRICIYLHFLYASLSLFFVIFIAVCFNRYDVSGSVGYLFIRVASMMDACWLQPNIKSIFFLAFFTTLLFTIAKLLFYQN